MKSLLHYAQQNRAAAADTAEATTKAKKALTMASMSAMVNLFHMRIALERSIAVAQQHGADIKQVKDLREVAGTEGFSRGLVAFADKAGSASQLFQDFPSVESLDVVAMPTDDARTVRALAGLDQVLSMEAEVAMADAAAVAPGTVALLKAFLEDLEMREDLGEDLAEAMKDKEVSDEVMGATTVIAISAADEKSRLELLAKVAAGMSTPVVFKDLTEEAAEALSADLANAVEALAPFTGLEKGENGISIDTAKIAEQFVANAGTLSDKGYTPASLEGLLRLMLSVIDSLENVRDNFDAIKDGYMSIVPAEEEPEGDDAENTDDENASDDDANADTGSGDENPSVEEAEDDTNGDTNADDGDAGGDDDDSKGDEEEPKMASEAVTCMLVCGFATVTIAVIDACVSSMTSVIELAEGVEKLGAIEHDDETEENEGGDEDGEQDGEEKPAEGEPDTAPTEEETPPAPAAAE